MREYIYIYIYVTERRENIYSIYIVTCDLNPNLYL